MDASRPVTSLEVTRRRIRLRHYSVRTERAYVYRIRQFVRYCGGRHPRDVDTDETEAFLTYLAVERAVSASTQNQAFSAILFLYRQVLERELPRLEGVKRAKKPKRLPTVLSPDEVRRVLVQRVCPRPARIRPRLPPPPRPGESHTLAGRGWHGRCRPFPRATPLGARRARSGPFP